jgi:DNA (cytosine-5)-methyltransferase 1
MKEIKFSLGELFCGPGGLALGAGLAETQYSEDGTAYSISHVWGVDRDPSAIESYKYNVARIYGGVGVCEDATTFCTTQISDYKRITALAFGFPCNDFSLVGKRKGVNGQYGELYKAGIIAIEKMNPYWFIAENVSGIHSANEGASFKHILRQLHRAGRGYNLTAHLYKFEEYGIPQFRHRFIVVGIRKDKKYHFEIPAPTHGKDKIPFVTAGKALSDIEKDAPNSEKTRQDKRIVERLKFIPPWKNAWFLDDLLKMKPSERQNILKQLPWYEDEFAGLSDYIICQRIEKARLLCTKARMSHIYKRLHRNKPAYTITGSGGGGTHVYHWEEHRALTNRERARLQSFDSSFIFKGSKEDVRKQIGMAVPPIGAKVIFEAILKTFAEVKYESIPSNYPLEDILSD